MRFKVSQAENPSHTAPVTCVGWSSTEEVYSAGDDGILLSWSVSNNTSSKVAQFNKDLYPTDMQFLPRATGTLGKHGDIILITAADGKFHILNRNGRIERSIEAHKGAILVGQWSNDGSGLLTGGEDGIIKIWSRSGMLRSTMVSSDNSIYAACWSPDSQSIAYTQGKCVVIKQLAPNTKPLKWKAHEGIVLCLAWSSASELIVSGGEDCRYRVWDSSGRQMFSSVLHDNHIVSLAWSPAGDLFAVGSYNTLRLCDYSGWSRSLEKPNTGCIYNMSWSADGTQLAAACANGHVLFAHVIERHVHYSNFTASLTERKTVTVHDVQEESFEVLDIPDRVIQMAMKYSYLVLTTPTQCYIYNTSNWNTPVIFDLKEGSVILLLLAEKHMLLVEKHNINLYNYQGRLIATPRWPNMRLETLKNSHISLSSDTLVVRDSVDAKIIYIIDLLSNRSAGGDNTQRIEHVMNISQISLDQWGPPANRNMAVLDRAKDLHIVSIKSTTKTFSKLGRKIESFQWNSEENLIAAIQDTQLIVWYCPQASYDTALLKLCSFYYDSPELGRSPRINDFVGNSVSVRKADGSLINVFISPLPSILLKYIQENKWQEALNLCRSMNNTTLWACLAVLSTQSSQSNETINIAEEAYANINHYEKVYYIKYMKNIPNTVQQKAALALLGGKHQDAESMLLHNGMVFQAIWTNIQLYKWTRALELAIKHKTHLDTVLYLRKQYLDTLGKPENNNQFMSIQENVKYDEEKVKEKLGFEMKKMNSSL
ncbi:intraflagellar transport protein 80 homolog [Coccinella septempunctata]|uniref:intraflagellar transport protein 80 homolog n=1 Tax=Coccinella septempunctata TaxID=41139 RepID=UPI001D08C247|nr:intraflagellar transport protein 80 homolog [Coccinella septempunctata]